MAEGSTRALPRQQDRVPSPTSHIYALVKLGLFELARTLLCGPGVSGEVVPPVPIPNTAVKRLSVDDTGGATLWENRPMPGPSLIKKELGLVVPTLFVALRPILPYG